MNKNKYNNYISDLEKEQIIKMYEEGYTTVAIGEKLNRNNSSIGRFLKKNNLKRKNYKNGILDSEIKDIVTQYKEGKTAKQILEKYKNKIKCEKTIINIVKRSGVDIRPRGKISYFNKNYFEKIDTEGKAYFLGLLLTDGNVHRLKRNTPQYVIQLQLNVNDIDIIEKFKKELDANTKIIIDDRKGKRNAMCCFRVQSKKLAEDLRKYGVVERKTLVTELTKLVPKELYRHYIRGIFDGDGTVFLRNKNNLSFGFYGTHTLVSQTKEWLVEEIGVNNNLVHDQKDAMVSFVTFSKRNDIINFYKLMYTDSSFYLKRKKDKFETYFKIRNIIV